LRSFRPEASIGLEEVMNKCLQKDRKRRHTNVAELALALADFGSRQSRPSIERTVRIIEAAGLSTSALALPPSPVVAWTPAPPTKFSKSDETLTEPEPGADAPLGTMAPSANTAPGVRGRPKALAILGAGTLSVAAAIGLAAWARHQPDAPQASLASGVPVGTSSLVSPANPVAPEPAKPIETSEPPTPATSQVRTVPAVPPLSAQAPSVIATRIDTKKGAGAKPPAFPPSVATASAALTPAPQTRLRANCNPPYVIDSAGDRQYKPECL
jgi:serine/threonine-protein kinase